MTSVYLADVYDVSVICGCDETVAREALEKAKGNKNDAILSLTNSVS